MQRKSVGAPSRVWIELERPVDDADGHAQAEKLDRWLKAVGVSFRHGSSVWWHEKNKRFCFVLDEAGGYVEANDNGHWYLLDGLIKLAEAR